MAESRPNSMMKKSILALIERCDGEFIFQKGRQLCFKNTFCACSTT